MKGGAEKSPDEDAGEEQTPVAGEWQFRVHLRRQQEQVHVQWAPVQQRCFLSKTPLFQITPYPRDVHLDVQF